MTYHFPTREDLIFAAFERFANESFSSLVDVMADAVSDTDPRERLVRMIVADSHDRKRDRVLLAELYVLGFRHERYAELMRQWNLAPPKRPRRAHGSDPTTLRLGDQRSDDDSCCTRLALPAHPVLW